MNKYNFIDKGDICSPAGFTASGISAGLKKSKKPDISLIYSAKDCVTAGVFTANKFSAAPVQLCKKKLLKNRLYNAIIINSGNANACTGTIGLKNAESMVDTAAEFLGKDPEKILVASTGVIGEQLPMDKVCKGIENAVKNLSEKNGIQAAEAIITTDTRPKYAAVSFKIKEKSVTIGGMIKGAGMIAPKMFPPHATLLAFLTTDAEISPNLLKKIFSNAANTSLNRITIDGDMSTNDSAFIMANGESGSGLISEPDSQEAELFSEALEGLMQHLAKETVKDGEGVTKFVSIKTLNAYSDKDAEKCCKSIAESLLCKTAWFGNDPNWGRIIAAVGYADIQFIPEKAEVFINGIQIVKNGMGCTENIKLIEEEVRKNEFEISVDLNEGNSCSVIWTNDLSYKYVEINAEYHT